MKLYDSIRLITATIDKSRGCIFNRSLPFRKGEIMQEKNDIDLLKKQIQDIMEEETASGRESRGPVRGKRKKKKKKILKGTIIILSVLLMSVILVLGTKPGRKILYGLAGDFIFKNMDIVETTNDADSDEDVEVEDSIPSYARDEDFVTNYLIFGIEEFGGASNTDSMMIASINTKDNSVKLTSLLRDSYVEIPGYKPNKLNSAYNKGGVKLLMETIELNYRINLDGYASVNFQNFEKIVDSLGGVTIELGEKEAKYLNTTNYISKKKYRDVKPGVNLLNGNQVLGYCRVRKVETLGGINNDYGRIVRQQRALSAIFDSLKSKNMLDQLDIVKECLGYVNSNLSK
ncbi:MAG: putative rane protein, partial [Herbinix sp.]|nr:putative rane protein [Herbinix sp.]